MTLHFNSTLQMVDEFSMNSKTTTTVSPLILRYRLIIHYLSIYALILIIVGTIGNLLTISVLSRRQLRRFSTTRYLIAVSLCDLISLYGWNLNNFYKFNLSSTNENIEDRSLIHCRFISFMSFSALQLSSWCLSAVSLGEFAHVHFKDCFLLISIIDRACGLFFLVWKQTYGKVRYTKYYIFSLALICCTLNSHILFFNGYQTSSGEIICYSTRSNPGYIYPQWQRVHLVLYNLCPFVIMLICNTYIIIVTVQSGRSQLETNSNSINRKSLDRYRQFTCLLMLVTFAFVLLTLPACIYFVFFRYRFALEIDRNYRFMLQISLNSIQFTSHGINFFLYCFSAKSFRNELREMFNEIICKVRRQRSRQRHLKIREQQRFHYEQRIPLKTARINYGLQGPSAENDK